MCGGVVGIYHRFRDRRYTRKPIETRFTERTSPKRTTAVAYWPLDLGRSRYDALAQELRRPQGRVWIGGDTTENSHSEGAVQAAQRMAREILARRAELLAPRRAPAR